tara:strand:- start:969 stop:1226 length:258 start_codon:yes stop_codon:yes gene_type:complete
VAASDLLIIVETDYRSRHMDWIEKRLNKRLEKWFHKTDEIEIDDWLAKQQSMVCKLKCLQSTINLIMSLSPDFPQKSINLGFHPL